MAARLKQWHNGADVVTRLEYEDTTPAPQLLRLVRHAEDILDDLAADTGKFAPWLPSRHGKPVAGRHLVTHVRAMIPHPVDVGTSTGLHRAARSPMRGRAAR